MTFEYAESREFWAKVFVSVACGALIGLERQLRGKPIGIRTSITICLGTMSYILLGERLAGDPTRVLGQVVTGVGFLGAGLMMNREGIVTGVTSAAVVWQLAAMGCAIGFGQYDFALILSLLSVLILSGVQKAERLFAQLRRGVHADD